MSSSRPGGWLGFAGRQAQCHGVASALVDLGELAFGPSEADLEAFHLAEPAFPMCLVDAGSQVVEGLDQPCPLAGIGPQHRTAQTGVLVDTGGGEGSGAGAVCHLAAFEVTA